MKKFIIAAVALGALASAASAAGNRSYDLRDLETFNAYTSDGIYLPAVKGGVSTLPKTVKMPAGSLFDHTDEHQNSSI